MEVEQMRCLISKVYEGPKWKDKVRHMPDNQVIAVYYKFAQNGKFDKKKKKPVKKEQFNKKVSRRELERMKEEGCFAEQLSFDF